MSEHTDSRPASKGLEGLRIKRAYSDWDLHVYTCPSCRVTGVVCGTEAVLRTALLSIGGDAR